MLIFTSRCACIARTVLSQDVCLSVSPSVTRRRCIETANNIIKLFSPSSSHIRNIMHVFVVIVYDNLVKSEE